jgi:hypothetical protein
MHGYARIHVHYTIPKSSNYLQNRYASNRHWNKYCVDTDIGYMFDSVTIVTMEYHVAQAGIAAVSKAHFFLNILPTKKIQLIRVC